MTQQAKQWKKGAIKDDNGQFWLGWYVQVPLHDVDTAKADGKKLTLAVMDAVQKKDKSFHIPFRL